MSKRRVGPDYEGDASPCGAQPPWVSKSASVPPRMRCVKRKGHPGKHQSAQDHNWEQRGGTPIREHRK